MLADFSTLLSDWLLLICRALNACQLRSSWLQMVSDTWVTLMPLSHVQLALGLTFGVDLEKGSQLQSLIKIIGMSHVTSASGYNVGLILNLTRRLTSRFYRFYGLLILLPLVWLYVWLCDFTPSVSRAALMSSLILIAGMCRRQLSVMRALVLTAVLVALVQPQWLGELSFQLSWLATLGIVWWLPMLNVECWLGVNTAEQLRGQSPSWTVAALWRWWWHEFWQNWSATLATQVTTWPLIFEHFQKWPVVTLLANPLLLWLTPTMTLLSGGYLVVTTITQPVLGPMLTDPVWGWWLGWPLRSTIDVFWWGVSSLAKLPFGEVVVSNWRSWHTYCWWMCLYLVWLRWRSFQRHQQLILTPYD